MKILVTGATGLLGSALCPALRDRGHDVRALIRFSSRTELQDLEGIEVIRGNLLETDSLTDAVAGVDAVVHAAASILGRDEESARKINVDATFSLLDALRRTGNPASRFVFVSSITAGGFGTSQHPLHEEMRPRPATHYGRTKLEAEALVREHGRRMPTQVLRLCTLYGPRDRFFPVLYRLLDLGLAPQLHDGELEMSFLHVDDAAEAVISSLELGVCHAGPLYVAGDDPVSWRGFCDAIQSALGRRRSLSVSIPTGLLTRAETIADRISSLPATLEARIPQQLCPDLMRLLTGSGLVCDGSAFRSATGFSQRIDLKRGMLDTINWYREHDLI
jgi:nucleoside-diphosphate-sugar epimerase